MERKLEKRFKVSYAGEVDYQVGNDGFTARYSAPIEFSWNGDYFETGIKPVIGCVRYESSSKWHEFPPAEVMALFPGFVALRLIYTPADNLPFRHPDHQLGTMEYQHDGPRPELIPCPEIPGWLTCRAVVELERREREEWEQRYAEKQLLESSAAS